MIRRRKRLICLGNNVSGRAEVRGLAYAPAVVSQLPPSVLNDEPSASFIGSGGLAVQQGSIGGHGVGLGKTCQRMR